MINYLDTDAGSSDVLPVFGHEPLGDQTVPLIAGEDLQKTFAGRATVLDGVSLRISEGERVALVGANGTGKSTLLRCLVGLTPLDAGTVDILGVQFSTHLGRRQQRALRRSLGFVFQFHGLVQRMSVLSNVVHGVLGQRHGVRAWCQSFASDAVRQDALSALDRVGLGAFAAARGDQLSGGQSQRVAIARAIVHEPRLLIADEPVASLDPAAAADVMALFSTLNERDGITLLFTTHNVEHALRYADRVIALQDGGIVLDAKARSLGVSDLDGIYRNVAA